MNQMMLMGRLGNAPVITSTRSGKKVANVSIGARRDAEKTDWFQLSAYDKLADQAEQYWTKGMKLLVWGHVWTGSYEKNGVKVKTYNVIVERFEYCESKNAATEESQYMSVPADIDEELPF